MGERTSTEGVSVLCLVDIEGGQNVVEPEGRGWGRPFLQEDARYGDWHAHATGKTPTVLSRLTVRTLIDVGQRHVQSEKTEKSSRRAFQVQRSC